jgi:hypothetical protein
MPGSFSRYFILAGLILFCIGAIIYVFEKADLRIGNLPGDIRIVKGNATCVIALGTSILLSILLTIIVNLVGRWLSK